MGFQKLDTDAGVAILDSFLFDKSYIEGFEASQADVVVFEAMSGAPAAKYVNASRWHKHIDFHVKKGASFPGEKKSLESYGPAESATAAAAADDDLDLFGESSEDEEAERAKAERLAAYQAKKALKPAVIAKSSVVIDVKPWDDETDLKEMERQVRALEIDGLLWGASKFVDIGYGIKKLQISCVIEDEKVGIDLINDSITELEELVQSVDTVSFNKV
jgi:elongation factor 1-beta